MGLPPGLSIAVLSRNRSLQMYDDPDTEERGEVHGETKYIEAITAAKFEVRATLDSTFDWCGCTAVRIIAVYDGAQPGWSQDILKGLDYTRTQYLARFAMVPKWCESSQQWQSGYLSFGGLETSGVPRPEGDVYTELCVYRRSRRCQSRPEEPEQSRKH